MRIASLVLAVAVTLAWSACAQAQQAQGGLDSSAARIGYTIGQDFGANLKQSGIQLDLEALIRGLRDAATGAPSQLTEEQMQAAMEELDKVMAAQQAQQTTTDAKENLDEGQQFLANNAKQEGVTQLPSGLQYRILKEGDGATPTADSTVQTHYRGTLIDGTEFDSSYRRGEPATFGVGQVIAGWTEALQLMQVGDKWQIFVPANLAYGERGAGGTIGPNATLIFEIELLGIQ